MSSNSTAAVPAPRRIHLLPTSPAGTRYVDADHVLPSGGALGFSAQDDASAARLLCGATARILRRVPRDASHVVVTGRGVLAKLVVTAFSPTGVHDGAPQVIVDTTGDPDVLSLAVERVADLGTVVVAGPSSGRVWAIDSYPHLHSRGLRLRGVDPFGAPAGHDMGEDQHLVDVALACLATPDRAGTLPHGWAWCRLGDP